jgi:hypothetical protein
MSELESNASSRADDAAAVKAMFAAAGFSPQPDEVDAFVRGYPALKAMVQMLYAVPEARYESPCLSFDPTIIPTEWS